MLVHRSAFRSVKGKTHRVNQDAGGAWTYRRPSGDYASLLLIADGVSAGRRSEEASRHVAESVSSALAQPLQDQQVDVRRALELLIEAVEKAGREVAERPHQTIASADATTLAAAICIDDEAAGVWCGDSRVYLLSSDTTKAVTRDHSWTEMAIAAGTMTYEQAARDPRARMITHWLGPPGEGNADLETFVARLSAGDGLLCCSDGLHIYFEAPWGREEELAAVVHRADSPEAATQELLSLASQRGGHDDISVAALLTEAQQP